MPSLSWATLLGLIMAKVELKAPMSTLRALFRPESTASKFFKTYLGKDHHYPFLFGLSLLKICEIFHLEMIYISITCRIVKDYSSRVFNGILSGQTGDSGRSVDVETRRL
jgi:hypothetical protein